MPFRFSTLGLGVLVGGVITASAAAEEREQPVVYRAPTICPTHTAFDARLAKHLGPAIVGRLGALVHSLTVTITPEEGEFVARLELVDHRDQRAIRQVAAATCEQATAAIALVAALAVRSQLERVDPTLEAPAAPGSGSATSVHEGSTPATVTPPSEPQDPRKDQPPEGPSPEVLPELPPAPPTPPPVVPPETQQHSAPAGSGHDAARLNAIARGGLELATGVGPGFAPGVLLGTSFTLTEFAQSKTRSLGLFVLVYDTLRRTYQPAEARLRTTKGRLEICPIEPSLSGSLHLSPCMGFELGSHFGRTFADGEKVAAARSESRLWAGGLLSTHLRYRKGRWAASTGATLGVPLTRNRFVLSRPERVAAAAPRFPAVPGVLPARGARVAARCPGPTNFPGAGPAA